MKYFNFLLENDINFSRDEAGNYVALVKVLNPAFYGGANPEQQRNANPSQQIPTTSNYETKKKVADSKRGFDQKGDTEGDFAFEGKPRSSSQANRYKSSNNYSASNRGQNSSVKKIKNVKNQSHFEKEKKNCKYFTHFIPYF